MTKGYQARAMQRALAKLGDGALLRGADAGNVQIARNVALNPGIGDTADDNFMVRYTIAAIENRFAPKVGDLLEHSEEGNFHLDRPVSDNGTFSRFIVVAAT